MFARRAVTSDAVIIARVTSLSYTHAWAKAGVMIGESTAPGSRHAFLLASPGNGLSFQSRAATDGPTTAMSCGTGGAPVWFRLERRGNTFTAARSADGATWTTLGSTSMQMSATVLVGLAVTSHNTGIGANATFTNVNVSGAAPMPPPVPDGWTATAIGPPGDAGIG